MSSTTPNIGLTLPTGAEKVSRQIINDNNTKIDIAIGTLNDNISTKANIINKSLPANSSVSFNSTELPQSYICTVQGNNADALFACIGCGYGATATRHKISVLIPSTEITVTPVSDAYGLMISSNLSNSYTISVIALCI